jgi:hypothetical protein
MKEGNLTKEEFYYFKEDSKGKQNKIYSNVNKSLISYNLVFYYCSRPSQTYI